MRIKLRLYTRDLDLIALKYIPDFRLGAAIRTALTEYVETGAVSRISVPAAQPKLPLPQFDQIDISIAKPSQQKVVDWLLSLKQGYRSVAIKTVVRAAIASPILYMYNINNDSMLLPTDAKNAAHYAVASTSPNDPGIAKSETQSPPELVENDDYKWKLELSEQASSMSNTTCNSPGDEEDELDLFDFDDFDNI